MKTKLLNRLLAIRGFTISMIVSMMILAAFPSPASAQTESSSDPAKESAAKLRNTFVHLQTGFPLTGAHLTVACEICHMGGIFKGTPRECAKCHTVGRLMAATPKHQDHIQTDQPCDRCHVSTASFQLAIMNHTGITQSCFTCHNGSNSAIRSKSANHIVTSSPCENCHKTTATFLGAGFNHIDASGSPIVGNCATCHNGITALGKPAGTAHISTSAACETCHTNTTTFLGATFDHTGITTGCASCHGGQLAGVKTKIAGHITTTAACETCHTSTTTFTAWTMDHTGYTNCASCHGGQYAGVVTKPANHITTSAACSTCHPNTSPGGFAAYTMSHTGITTGCASCHTGATVGTATILGKPATHIPTTVACESCHTSTGVGGFMSWTMNHTVVTGTPCSTCHGTGVTFYNVSIVTFPDHSILSPGVLTTSNCAQCHSTTTFLGAGGPHTSPPASTCDNGACHGGGAGKPKISLHIPTALNCSACHTWSSFAIWSASTVHSVESTTACANCHDSSTPAYQSVVKKPSSHIPYNGGTPCNTCHPSTSSFAVWTMGTTGHTAVNATLCANCHNTGMTYPGVVTKQASHMTGYPAQDCGTNCHTASTTASFSTFLGFNMMGLPGHTSITVCAGCHNGVTAMGKPTSHLVTTADCGTTCHTPASTNNYTTFLGATGSHTSAPAADCYGCHGGGTPGGVGTGGGKAIRVGHIPTGTLQCSLCHTWTGFAGATMSHTAVAATRCDACHNGSYTSQGTLGAQSKTFITNHIPTTITGALDCNTCHSGVISLTTAGFNSGEHMNHNGAQGGGTAPAGVYCVNCHISGATYMGTMQKKSHNGASTAKDCSRSSCHKPLGSEGSTYSSW